jgi:hypothetical protein
MTGPLSPLLSPLKDITETEWSLGSSQKDHSSQISTIQHTTELPNKEISGVSKSSSNESKLKDKNEDSNNIATAIPNSTLQNDNTEQLHDNNNKKDNSNRNHTKNVEKLQPEVHNNDKHVNKIEMDKKKTSEDERNSHSKKRIEPEDNVIYLFTIHSLHSTYLGN